MAKSQGFLPEYPVIPVELTSYELLARLGAMMKVADSASHVKNLCSTLRIKDTVQGIILHTFTCSAGGLRARNSLVMSRDLRIAVELEVAKLGHRQTSSLLLH